MKVTIRCFAYNHEPYIRKCLEGLVMQKTNFKYEAIVHDDASTDETAAIIREFAEKHPEIIKPIIQTENQYSKQDGSIERIMETHTHGKYVAICEGDDYWTDPLKLQKQIDFLEHNPEYGMCYTKARHFFQNDMRFRSKERGGPNVTYTELLEKNTIPTLTVVYDRELYKNYYEEIQPYNKGWAMGDYPTWLWFAQNSKIKFIPEVTGVYRILTNSAAHSPVFEKNVAFIDSTFDIKRFFLSKYPQEGITLEDIEQQRIQRLFSLAFNHKEEDALKEYYRNLKKKNFSIFIKYWIRRHLWNFNKKK